MNDPFQGFKFLTPTSFTINDREAMIKAEIYQSSKEQYLLKRGDNAVLLRLYSVTYAGKESSHLLNEVDVMKLIGQDRFFNY